jgi:hypothetical protein
MLYYIFPFPPRDEKPFPPKAPRVKPRGFFASVWAFLTGAF